MLDMSSMAKVAPRGTRGVPGTRLGYARSGTIRPLGGSEPGAGY
jgi:hypothetical protein